MLEIFLVLGGIILLVILFVIYRESQTRKGTLKELNKLSNFLVNYSYASSYSKTGIAVDTSSCKIAFRAANGKIKIYDFDQILNAEVKVNDEQLISTNRGSQLVGAVAGGVLFGGIGALAGAMTGSKKQKSKISKIQLYVSVNDMESPLHIVTFYDSVPVSANGIVVEETLKEAEIWIIRINGICNQIAEGV